MSNLILPVYVLIGGASTRFGVCKAAVRLDGLPWADDVGQRLSRGEDYTFVGHCPEQSTFAASRFLADAQGVGGPLAGVLRSLRDRQQQLGDGLLVLASCDLVQPDPAWLAPLQEVMKQRTDLDIASYRAADRWQPFPSVAHTRWLMTLEKSLRQGTTSLQQALDEANSAAIPWTADASGPPQANTPEELRRLAPDVTIDQ